MDLISRKEAKEKGLKYYYTGEPCRHGNVDLRYTPNSKCQCMDCMKDHRETYCKFREANRESRNEYNRQ